MTERTRVLVVEDEEGVRFVVKEAMQQAGYVVLEASSGEEALELLQQESFDLIVLDLVLGGRVDGQRVLEAVRWRWSGTVVVILTAHGSLESAVDAIQEGIDGYLLKPIETEELLQTVGEALERRQRLGQETTLAKPRLLECGPFCLNLTTQQVTKEGDPLHLTLSEFRLLSYLMWHANEIVTSHELVRVARQYECEDPREASQIAKWYIYRLRCKVEPDPSHPQHILSVRGSGYEFRP
jgi:DNA-binding response OmpR family regulator